MPRQHVPTPTAPYPGVTWVKKHRAWQAQVSSTLIPGKTNLAWSTYFDEPEDAAHVRDVMEQFLRGPDAVISLDGQPPANITKAEILQQLLDWGADTRDLYLD